MLVASSHCRASLALAQRALGCPVEDTASIPRHFEAGPPPLAQPAGARARLHGAPWRRRY
jgi:hypothetical protein